MGNDAPPGREYGEFLLLSQIEPRAIGRRIALARLEQGIRQRELAERATFSRRSLQHYERGDTIPWTHMREISELLGRPVEWFVHGPQSTEPTEGLLDRLAGQVLRIDRRLAAIQVLIEDLSARVDDLAGRFDSPDS